MKFTFFLLSVFILFSAYSQTEKDNFFSNPVELVNPLMGSDSEFSLSNGNTYPAIARPWGMNFWAPQTNKMGDGWMRETFGLKWVPSPTKHYGIQPKVFHLL